MAVAVGIVEAQFHGAKDHRSAALCLRSQPPFPRQAGAYRALPGSPRPVVFTARATPCLPHGKTAWEDRLKTACEDALRWSARLSFLS